MTPVARRGLSLVEVIVAMAVLAILGAALVGVLPLLSQNTRASTIDAGESQRMYEVFERVSLDWTNSSAWTNEQIIRVDAETGQSLEDFVDEVLPGCTVTVNTIVEGGPRKRVLLSCPEQGNLPMRELRAEFGAPLEVED